MKRVLSVALTILFLGILGALGGCDLGAGSNKMIEGKDIYYRYTYAARNLDREIRISQLGDMSVEQVNGADHALAQMKLTPVEQSQLAAAFKDWKELKPYYSVIFGPVFVISYDGYKVESSGAADTPDQFLKAKTLLDKLADEAIAQSKPPATSPATQR